MRRQGILLLAAALLGNEAIAADETCGLDPGDLAGYAINFRAHALGVADLPLQSPASSQVGATANTTADDPVPDASFPAIIAMNLGIPTSSTDGGAMTFDLTPFALVAARNSDVIGNQSEYARYDSLRRIGAAVTLGGKGEAFDRDGDGTVDDALTSTSLGDIVSFELRYRFAGSRDRRDSVNEKRYFRAMGKLFDPAAAAFTDVTTAMTSDALKLPPQADGLYCMSDAEQLADSHAAAIDPAVMTTQLYLDARTRVLEEIDSAPIWTAVVGATNQKDEFGPDRWWLGVRGAGGLGPDQGWSVSLDYGETDSLAGGESARRIKAGLEWASLIGKKWVSPKQGGIRASLSGAWEKWTNVPGAANDDVASLNLKLVYPLSDTISVPLSITWANKKDLLRDESEIRGYIGFTFDFDGAIRKALLGEP
ncbi:MAG TPA: hypothetical protein VE046_01735 [Steroidobacteraceae bacterium]|nr:hypothetical protein [Steroidobacteraceae bacterium]